MLNLGLVRTTLVSAVFVGTALAPNVSWVFGMRAGVTWSRRYCKARRWARSAAVPRDAYSDPVHVAYASDKNNLFGLLGSIKSLVEHMRTPEDCHIHVITPQSDSLLLQRAISTCLLKSLPSTSHAPRVVIHESRLVIDPWMLSQNVLWPLPAQSFERLHLDDYLPGVRRVVYLDTDTIVRADVAELFHMPMRYTLAAVSLITSANELTEHRNGFWRVRMEHLLRNLTPSMYFNSGVLVIDLKRWRLEDRGRRLGEWLKRTRGFLGDQIALNLDFFGDFELLDWRWNTMVGTSARRPFPGHCGSLPICVAEEAGILHWACTRRKPFHRDQHGLPPPDVQYEYFERYDLRENCPALDEGRVGRNQIGVGNVGHK